MVGTYLCYEATASTISQGACAALDAGPVSDMVSSIAVAYAVRNLIDCKTSFRLSNVDRGGITLDLLNVEDGGSAARRESTERRIRSTGTQRIWVSTAGPDNRCLPSLSNVHHELGVHAESHTHRTYWRNG